jgi:hypothetical protein
MWFGISSAAIMQNSMVNTDASPSFIHLKNVDVGDYQVTGTIKGSLIIGCHGYINSFPMLKVGLLAFIMVWNPNT